MKPWSGAASHILLGQMRGPEIILGYGIGRCFMGNQWCPWVLHVVSMYTQLLTIYQQQESFQSNVFKNSMPFGKQTWQREMPYKWWS